MKRRSAPLASILVILLTALACSPGSIAVSYRPIGLPIELSLNDRGELSFGVSASVVTPIGEFSIGATLPLAENNSVLLILRDRNRKPEEKVFQVNVGRNITVVTNGKTQITISADGYVIIDITDGSVDNIEIYDSDVVKFGDDGKPQCAGFESIHQKGDAVVVDFNQIGALRVLTDYRGGPNQTIVQAYDNDRLELRDGPICYNLVWYWRVYFAKHNVYGWVAERTDGYLHLCPTYQPECA